MDAPSRQRQTAAPVEPGAACVAAAGSDAAEPDILAQLRGIEDALVVRSIDFAKTNGYAPYTTTIRAAWSEAVRSVSEALCDFLTTPRAGPGGPQADIEYRYDPRFARMRKIARLHRSIGITLELYLGLFKHFRRVYLDALGGLPADQSTRARLLDLTQDFFDETELSVTADWTRAGDDHRLQELQGRTRALTLAKDRYVAIFESLRHPAFLLDRSRALKHANHAALDLFVGDAEAGDSLYRQGRGELSARMARLLGGILGPETAAGAPAETTVWLDTTDGKRCFDLRVRSLHDAVETIPLGHLVQLYDITAYREATEQAQRAERQMSRFLATMSHEIRTPLHAVLGAAELLREAERSTHDTYVDVIQSAGQSLLQTLNNVLDYSKLENGAPAPQPADTEIVPALRAFCGMAKVAPEGTRTGLELEIAPDMPERVRIDWAMTRQILTNLVSNALRHDDGRGVVLRVATVAAQPGAPPSLRLAVVDHGTGLSEADARSLFRPFEDMRARPTHTGGSGLGLAISRYLVGALGGEIGFETGPCGTEVWFEVPFSPADAGAPPEDLEPVAARPAGGHCLLVDDDPIGALVTVAQLARAGFSVDRAGTIAEAREALGRAVYDAVVVDYLLPDGVGPDLLAGHRSGDARGAPLFVALTANVEALNASADQRAGFYRVLAKPTDTAGLAEALRGAAPARPGAGGGPAKVSAVSAPHNTRASGFEGLSPRTIAAMAEAFRAQWAEFRIRLRAAGGGPRTAELRDMAHRLAGSSAQLGLHDLVAPLRELERRCETAGRPGDISDLLCALDRPVERTACWRRLFAESAPSAVGSAP